MAALIPPETVCGHSVPTILFDTGDDRYLLFWIGLANSLVVDFVIRKKVRLHITYTVLDSIPFPRDLAQTRVTDEIIERVYKLCAVGIQMEQFRENGRKNLDLPNSDSNCLMSDFSARAT